MTDKPSSYSLGAKLILQTLKSYPDTDCVFCTNDDLAVGAIFECQKNNIAVPQQMAIVGFHGHDVGQSMVPQLASVITPRQHIGNLAGERLLSVIDSKQDEVDYESVFDVGYKIHLGESA